MKRKNTISAAKMQRFANRIHKELFDVASRLETVCDLIMADNSPTGTEALTNTWDTVHNLASCAMDIVEEAGAQLELYAGVK